MGLAGSRWAGIIEGGRPKTAETHRYAIMKEFDLQTIAELTRYAVQHGVVSLE